MGITDERAEILGAYSENQELQNSATDFLRESSIAKYSYCFDWLGRPIIQYPQDIVAFQEVVARVKPDLIIETGIAHGGSLVLSASLLCLLDVMDGLDPRQSPRKVIGIDIDIRPHNKQAIGEHPLNYKIELIEGSSVDPDVIAKVRHFADNAQNVLVSLDSNHTHAHVLSELQAYADLVSIDSYCIVFDTLVEDLPVGSFPNRPWDVGDNPKTAVHEWLAGRKDFVIDSSIDEKLLVSVAPDGYLRRVC